MFSTITPKAAMAILIGMLAFTLIACGDGSSGRDEQAPPGDTGAIAFKIVFEPNPDNRQQGKAFSSCHDINTVTAQAYDVDGESVSQEMRWPCREHMGILKGVKEGVDRQILVQGLWIDDKAKNLIYCGTATGLTVKAGETTYIDAFVVKLEAPSDLNELEILLNLVDQDDDNYSINEGDCDDSDPKRHPGMTETCNDIDDDCDGYIDEGLQIYTYYQDLDNDGFGNPGISTMDCAQPTGYALNNGDCDDVNNDINPDAEEICNEIDDNCNGMDDEPYVTFYRDDDGDGYGGNTTVETCAGNNNIADNSEDCNDASATINPASEEVCDDNLDNNCNGEINEHCPWNKEFGESQTNVFYSVIKSAPGGYILAGLRGSYSDQNTDGWLLKINDNGNEIMNWDKTFAGGQRNDSFRSITKGKEGGYVVAGTISTPQTNGGWLIRVDEDGNEVENWNKTFAANNGKFNCVIPANDSGYVIVGDLMTTRNEIYSKDGWFIKVNENGDEITGRNKKIGGTGYDVLNCVISANDGNGYIAVGAITLEETENTDGWLVKFDENGNEVTGWNKSFGGEELDFFNTIISANDGGYILAGQTFSSGQEGSKGWVMKVDENGYEVTEWNKIYYNGQDFTSIVPSNTGKGYVLAGSTRYGGWLIEVDENGIVNNGGWEINIGNTMGQYIYFNSVIQDDHGGYIIAGRRQYYTEGSETAICIKFDNNGITSAFP